MYRLSGATFVRDTLSGAFCLFESMASMLPFVDDLIVLDLGSTDGTSDILDDIAAHNRRVHVYKEQFSREDASAFADAANRCIELAAQDVVLFWQADEIWHQNLLARMVKWLHEGHERVSFWRYQLRDNFQHMKWFPHPVHRIGRKDSFRFVNDGMNTVEYFGVPLCSEYDGGWFTKWGGMDELQIPTHDMVLDVSLVGGFRDNIVRRRELHAPMWHENTHIEGIPADKWLEAAKHNPDWNKQATPFDIPVIMQYHVGKTSYLLRDELLHCLREDTTWTMLGLESMS